MELGEYGLGAAIRTQESLEKTIEILETQNFLRWDSDLQAWKVRKRWNE